VSEHAHTVLLSKILQSNIRLGDALLNKKDPSMVLARWVELQQSVNVLFTSNTSADSQCEAIEKRTIHWEQPLKVPSQYKAIIHQRIASLHWEFLEREPIEVNETMVWEFYANYQAWETKSVFLWGTRLDTSNQALEAILNIPHILLERDEYSKLKADVFKGKVSLTPILERIGRPGASWEYSKGRNSVPTSIAYSDLNTEARIWYQIVADYIIPSTHTTH
ncbi:hypothetical protein S83_051285, partial [Arachis hypogaea]